MENTKLPPPLKSGDVVIARDPVEQEWGVGQLGTYLPRSEGYRIKFWNWRRNRYGASRYIPTGDILGTVTAGHVSNVDQALRVINRKRMEHVEALDRVAQRMATQILEDFSAEPPTL